jgi:site-specific DNA recombinase
MTAGLRLYRGEIVGEAAGVTPIIPREQWERVRAELASRSPGTTSGLRRWLNGTLICDKCGAKMAGKSRGKSVPAYVCAARPRHGLAGCGRLAISAEPTEVTVAAWIVGYLARDDIADALTVGVSDDAAQAARTEAAADEAQLKELATMWGRKQLTTAEYLAARKEIEGRLAKWQGVVKAAMPQAVRDLYGASHIKPADAFEAMAPTQKQAVAGFLFPRGVAVAPHAGGLRGFDPSRLRIANSVPQ